MVEGTRRWLPDTPRQDVEDQLAKVFGEGLGARDTGTTVTHEINLMRDAFRLDESAPIVGFSARP